MANQEDKKVMNGAGIAELGFPMWPSFNEETLEDVLVPLKNGKVNYWTGPKGMEFEKKWVWNMLFHVQTERLLCILPSAVWA